MVKISLKGPQKNWIKTQFREKIKLNLDLKKKKKGQ